MVEDVYSQSAAQHERYVGVPRHRWLYYEYDTGEILCLHLLRLICCADMKQNNNCCLAWQHALIDPQLVHAFAGDPEDAISRKRKLSVWSMLQVCPLTFSTHSLAFAAMLPPSLCKLCLQCCLLSAVCKCMLFP